MELYDPSVIRAIKNKYKFKFSKSLGQNFLTDKAAIDGIIDGAGITADDLVIEIGPGIGTLTAAAAEKAAKVLAIEIDRNLIEIMKFTLLEYNNIEVINGNILDTDLNELIRKEREKREYRRVIVIGNLPYYITSPILMKLLESKLDVHNMTVMMQKEVAERIMAQPGSRTYGAITVAVGYYSTVSLIEEVDHDRFMPPPKVDSAVVNITPREKPQVDVEDEATFFRCVKAAFSQRRKTLQNSLKVTGWSKEDIDQVLTEAGVDGRRRAETLDASEFAKIADGFYRKESISR